MIFFNPVIIFQICFRGRRGRDHIVIGFIATCAISWHFQETFRDSSF
jgi:hypothetical protein